MLRWDENFDTRGKLNITKYEWKKFLKINIKGTLKLDSNIIGQNCILPYVFLDMLISYNYIF